jgi:hypothetical protein
MAYRRGVVFSNSGVPGAGFGNNGDCCVNSATGILYLKTSGTWSSVGSFVGPTGSAGSAGAAGTNGTNGTNALKYAGNVTGTGLILSYTVTHGLGTTDISNVAVYQSFGSKLLMPLATVAIVDANNITFTVTVALPTGTYRVVIAA